MRERLAALEMISGFVDDAPSGDGLEHGKRFDGLGRHGQRISGKLYKIRVVSGSDCTDGMIPCAALGGIDGIGFEGVERGDSLIWAENAPRRGCAVDGGMDGTLEYRELGVFFEQALRHAVIAEYNHPALNGKISGDAEFGESERVCMPHVAQWGVEGAKTGIHQKRLRRPTPPLLARRARLYGCPASINMDDLPRDIVGRRGSEEHGQSLNIFREAHPLHGGLPGEGLDDFRPVRRAGR